MPMLKRKTSRVDVLCGDCREIVPQLGKFDLVFLDPPFNIDQKYNEYEDEIDPAQFLTLLIESVTMSKLCCYDHKGVVALHGADNLAVNYLTIAQQLSLQRQAWVNWHYRFGQCNRTNWIDARCHCLVYAHPGHTWNPDEVLVESDRASTYGDSRVNDTDNGGKRLPGTVWGVKGDGPYWGRVQGNSKERRKGHPNQLPEVYLERLIRAYTKPGDRVLDMFGGSGTTAVVAQALQRDCTIIDVSQKSCDSIKRRVEAGAVRV